MKTITKDFLMQKIMEKWMAENPQMLEDITKLAYELTMFNAKWGTKLEPRDVLSVTQESK